jgi:peptidoglycan/LPS O-acetylase OafA/YrhL
LRAVGKDIVLSSTTTPQIATAPSVAKTSAERGTIWPTLAGLRWYLAFVVLCEHVDHYSRAPIAFAYISRLGAAAAVIGFFVVSGYSIAHSITDRPSGFLKRRIQRIYPIFLVSYALAMLSYVVWGHNIPIYSAIHIIHMPAPGILSAIGGAFLLNGFLVDRIPTLGMAWTLSIEFFFYLLAPLFIRMRQSQLWGLALLSCLAYVGHRRLIHDHYLLESNYGIGALILAWPWLFGFLMYLNRGNWKINTTIFAIAAMMIYRWPQDGSRWSMTTVLLTIAIISFAPTCRGHLAKFLNLLGDLSYPQYMLQGVMFVLLLAGPTERPYYLLVLVPIAASIVAYYAIDVPFRKRSRRQRIELSSAG